MPQSPCLVCGNREWRRLPDPGPRSMISDLRVVAAPLGKAVCARCGVVERVQRMPADLFDAGYTLYAHPPADPREMARQRLYAAWIAGSVARPPASVVDVGCGNGSLLLALRELWPDARLAGCDPSPEAVAQGRGAGLDLWVGTVDAGTTDTDRANADLVISVNVVEHTADPIAFLVSLASHVGGDGTVVIVCPDATMPNVELLMADHEHSLVPVHLGALLARVGLEVDSQSVAPLALGPFQMAVARRRQAGPRPTTGSVEMAFAAAGEHAAATQRYLQGWAGLDAHLLDRSGGAPLVCFGTGEAAGLLRAYAPRTWARVRACTADSVAPGGTFGDLPIVPLSEIETGEAILIGVRPQDQRAVAERLRGGGHRVVAWYDVL